MNVGARNLGNVCAPRRLQSVGQRGQVASPRHSMFAVSAAANSAPPDRHRRVGCRNRMVVPGPEPVRDATGRGTGMSVVRWSRYSGARSTRPSPALSNLACRLGRRGSRSADFRDLGRPKHVAGAGVPDSHGHAPPSRLSRIRRAPGEHAGRSQVGIAVVVRFGPGQWVLTPQTAAARGRRAAVPPGEPRRAAGGLARREQPRWASQGRAGAPCRPGVARRS